MSSPTPDPARGVILERNTSSRPVLHLYQASSKHSLGYSCYRAETRNQIQTQEGEIISKVKKAEVVILVSDMSSIPVFFITNKYHQNIPKSV